VRMVNFYEQLGDANVTVIDLDKAKQDLMLS